ncbi:MAG: hypothetical protein AAGA56_22945 [Myxococcota bacterium]
MRPTIRHCFFFPLTLTTVAAACSGGTEPVRLVGGGASGTEPTRPGVTPPAGAVDAPPPLPSDDQPTTTPTTTGDGGGAGEPGGTGGDGGMDPSCATCSVAIRSPSPSAANFCPGARDRLNGLLVCACAANMPGEGGAGANSCLDECDGFCVLGGPTDATCESCLVAACPSALDACVGE